MPLWARLKRTRDSEWRQGHAEIGTLTVVNGSYNRAARLRCHLAVPLEDRHNLTKWPSNRTPRSLPKRKEDTSMQTSKRMCTAALFIVVKPGNHPSTDRFTSGVQHIQKAESPGNKKKHNNAHAPAPKHFTNGKAWLLQHLVHANWQRQEAAQLLPRAGMETNGSRHHPRRWQECPNTGLWW